MKHIYRLLTMLSLITAAVFAGVGVHVYNSDAAGYCGILFLILIATTVATGVIFGEPQND